LKTGKEVNMTILTTKAQTANIRVKTMTHRIYDFEYGLREKSLLQDSQGGHVFSKTLQHTTTIKNTKKAAAATI